MKKFSLSLSQRRSVRLGKCDSESRATQSASCGGSSDPALPSLLHTVDAQCVAAAAASRSVPAHFCSCNFVLPRDAVAKRAARNNAVAILPACPYCVCQRTVRDSTLLLTATLWCLIFNRNRFSVSYTEYQGFMRYAWNLPVRQWLHVFVFWLPYGVIKIMIIQIQIYLPT